MLDGSPSFPSLSSPSAFFEAPGQPIKISTSRKGDVIDGLRGKEK
jgi:hypothetical protein